MKKLVVIVNCQGGVGKDTLCDSVSTRKVSSIDPIKAAAEIFGYKESEKTEAWRGFLSALKKLLTDLNDYPTVYVVRAIMDFMADENHQVIFVHIREPEEISKLCSMLEEKEITYATVLITRGDKNQYNNKSDDGVFDFKYDVCFSNEKPIAESSRIFRGIIQSLIETIGKEY